MNDFEEFFCRRQESDLDKWSNYFALYERYFAPFRSRPVRILEIGVSGGGSLRMWERCFPLAESIVGVDINPACRRHAGGRVEVEIGSQSDPVFLEGLKKRHAPFDIIIDDGGHMMDQQICSFEHLFGHLRDGGIYLVEDCATSYWPGFNGSLRNRGSFIEYAKGLVDGINACFVIPGETAPAHPWAGHLSGIFFHTGVVVFERGADPVPTTGVSGCAPDPAGKDRLLAATQAYIDQASPWRVLFWCGRVVFHALFGPRALRQLYLAQLRYRWRRRKAAEGGA